MPYRVFPLNLTSGDTIPHTGFAARVGYENPGVGDPADAVITLICRDTANDHLPHADSTQRGQSVGPPIDFPLDHSASLNGVTIRGVICSMDPFQERDAFEVSNITITASHQPPFEVSPVKQDGPRKLPVLSLTRGQDKEITMKYTGKLAAKSLLVFFQQVGRHGVPHILQVFAFDFKAEVKLTLPKQLWATASRLNLRLAATDGTVIKEATTIPIEITGK